MNNIIDKFFSKGHSGLHRGLAMLLASLSICNIANAQQPVAEGEYYIQFNNNASYYLSVSSNNYKTGQPYLNTSTTKDLWQLVKCDDNSYYYIIHVSDGKYVVANYSGSSTSEKAVHLESTNTPGETAKFSISQNGTNLYNIFPKGITNNSFNSWGGAGGDIGVYGKDDGGSKWKFVTPPTSGYVFYTGSNYCNGTTAGTTDFNPATCLWAGSSGSTFTNGSVYLYRNLLGTFSFSTNSSSNCTLGGTEDGKTGQTIYVNNNKGYLRYNGKWETANDKKSYVVFKYTRTFSPSSQTLPSVSGGPVEINALSTTAGTYTRTDASYQPAYDDYVFYDGTHHYCIGTTYKGNSIPTETLTYTWILEGIDQQYATINQNGVIDYKKSVTNSITATVKVKATTQSGTVLESQPYSVTFRPIKKFYISISVTAGQGGSVSTTPATLPTVCYGENMSSTSAQVQVTLKATPDEHYAFVRWEDANGQQVSTAAEYTATLTATSETQSSPTAYAFKAIFQELPKFYYTIRYAIHTDYADGSKSSGDGGTVTQSSTETKMVYGTTLDATSAEVSASGITLTATAKNGFSFTNWTLGGTEASTSNPYSPGNLTVKSKTESSPTVFTFTANFNEFPIFYAKLNMEMHEYLASTHEYSTENKGSSAKFSDDVILEDGYLVIHATSASQTSASQDISVEALEGEGFGFRGWSTTEVPAENIGTASYASNARIYTMPVTTSSKTKLKAEESPITIHAYFEEFPIFYFDVKTQVIPMSAEAGGEQNPGTASVNPAGIQEFYASSLTATEGTASATFSATAKTGYKFGGWYRKNADGTYTEVSKYNPYSARLKSSSKDINNPTETTMYAQFLVSMLTISAQDIELDTESDGWLEITVTPKDAWKSYIITSDKPSLVYVDNSGHCRTNLIPGTTQIHIQGVTTDGQTPDELYTTVNAKVRIKCRMPLISFSPSDDGTKAMLTLTRAADDAKDGTRLTTLYYTTDDPSGSGVTWHKYDGTPVAVDPDATVYAKSKMLKADGSVDSDYTESNIARADYVKPQVETPSVLIDKDGITFTTSTPGTITYYYIVNDAIGGTDPTTTSYTGTWTTGSAKITGIDSEKYIRVIATRQGYEQSPVGEGQNIMSSGINGNTVILNDYEDHNWTYYAGVDPSIDGGNYNTNYKNIMYSPDPRNVKITYKGGGITGASAVAISGISGEDQNVMIYYKTIEKTQVGETGDYAYHVIPNPFSKRPKKGGTYYGFGGWKLVSGGEYISEYSNEAILPLEPTIHFTNLDNNYSPNCTSAEIVFEATWVEATVIVQNSLPTFTGGTYETNFWVINGNASADFTVSKDMTVTQMTPDGGATADYRSTAVTRNIKFAPGDGVTPKLEWMTLNENNRFTPDGKNMFIGRGVTNSQSPSLYFLYTNNNTTVNQVVRVESGKFGSIRHYQVKPSAVKSQVIYLGCDYDRAKGDNTKLEVTGNCVYSDNDVVDNEMTWATRTFILSGDFCNPKNHNDGNLHKGETAFYYMGKQSSSSKVKQGRRYLEVQGGLLTNTAGGSNSDNNKGDVMLQLRVKGGTIRGIVFGCARGNNTSGSRAFILTGGLIKGWITPGTNGTVDNAGKLDGYGYLYVGGNSAVDSNGDESVWTHSAGGNVFGAGCGIDNKSTRISGANTMGTNTVIADNAYVERGVYGGGSFGYSEKVANVYITGGHVAGKKGGISATDNNKYDANVQGGVYGGSCQNKGGDANIYMTGGLVETGVYGGSNTSGTLSGSVKMILVGGQVGTSTTSANIHGGGFGADTGVSGNVDVNIGMRNASTDDVSGNAVIYGDVYGGSALGNVNGTKKTDTYHTNVTLNGGTIYGSLYGGGLGNASTPANVYGPVAVEVYGGSVKKTDENGLNGSGAVYGANNKNGAPQNSVTVDIFGTDVHNAGPDTEKGTADDEYAIYSVFGGGNQAPYTYGNGYPKVTVNDCGSSIYRVYGGGNQAAVSSTDLTINGGMIGKAFGGGYGADVNNNVSLKIHGGRILKAFGGNDSGGEVKGNISILVSQAGYTESTCPIDMDYLYGGGNNADSKTASMDIRYANNIGYVFGGACAANMSGSIDLNIVAGKIGTVFGGNDQSGTISGDHINVTVKWLDEEYEGVDYKYENNSLGSVYGGGNVAAYAGSTQVKVLNATLTGNVYGGGKKADIGKSTKVIIGDWNPAHAVVIGGDVYGGGDKAAVKESTDVTINDCGTLIQGDVYGGGNAAEVGSKGGNSGSTTVTVWGGTMDRIFGGGHGYPTADPPIGADIYGSTNVNFYGGTVNGVFGGSNSVGNITVGSNVFLEQQLCPNADDEGYSQEEECELNLQEAYGAGNEAFMEGEPSLTIGCVDALGEIYGGSRNADVHRDIVLNVNSGTFRRIFGGNNEGGCIKGSITVNVEETGCHPIVINELYGCGNQAAYSVYGYDDDGTPRTTASGNATPYNNPQINVISCTNIGTVYGGGYGEGAKVIGSPTVHIDMQEGKWSGRVSNEWGNRIGTIGAVFGGGNAAKVDGNTNVEIGTEGKSANISGNIYGGGNQAEVTGNASVTIGR